MSFDCSVLLKELGFQHVDTFSDSLSTFAGRVDFDDAHLSLVVRHRLRVCLLVLNGLTLSDNRQLACHLLYLFVRLARVRVPVSVATGLGLLAAVFMVAIHVVLRAVAGVVHGHLAIAHFNLLL